MPNCLKGKVKHMKKRTLSLISMLLVLVMLMSTFIACTPDNGDTATDSEKATEKATESGTTKETDGEKTTEKATEESGAPADSETDSTATDSEPAESGTEAETDIPLDTSALELNKTDLFPEYEEYVKTSSYVDEPINIRIEAEDYVNSTIPWKPVSGSEFSGGALMRALVTGENNLPEGLNGKYYAEYKITVPKAGFYSLKALAGTINADWTTEFTITLDGEEIASSLQSTIADSFKSPSLGDNGLIKYLDFGKVELTEGEHTLCYVVSNSDLNTIQWGPRMSSFIDYMEFSVGSGSSYFMDMGYDVPLTGVKDSSVIVSASKVHVYDCRFPIQIKFADFFAEDGEKEYFVEDYFGNKIVSGKMEGYKNEVVTITLGLKDHPTGYFTFRLGDHSETYVVTPSLDDRYEGDTPFAMDFASSYMIKDINQMVNVASAAKLAGVTWVRERAHWENYEKSKGVYDFSSTDKHFNAIKKVGLNLLSVFYVSPAWALESVGPTTSRAGAFADTQLEIYNAMKATTSHYKGVVDAWEIWNESDGGFALETAELYTAWFKAAALGAVAGDPNVIVSHGGYCIPNEHALVAGTSSDYVHLSLMNDMLDYSSVFNYHSHIEQNVDFRNVDYRKTGVAKWIYPTMALYGATSMPIWVTEAGMRMRSLTPTEDMKLAQTPYIVTSTAQSMAMGTDKHYWFLLAPYTENGGDFGTFSPELDPYPTLAAEAVMTKVLGKGEYLGYLPGLMGKSHYGPFGIVFNTGSRIASVLWLNGNETKEYTFDAELPVIITDIMGNETLVHPTDGKITVTISKDPIYITYSTPPVYYAEENAHLAEIQPLEFTDGQKVILSPEFEDYNINDAATKQDGHIIKDCMEIKVRVTNFNDHPVTGTVKATLDGFTVDGCDKEITVQPYSEEFVTLTIYWDVASEVNEYMTFVGTFNGEETSKAVAHVRTSKDSVEPGCSFKAGVNDGTEYKAEKLKSVLFIISDDSIKGDIVIMLNDTEIDTYSYNEEKGRLTVDISSIAAGNYVLTVARKTETGYCDFYYIYVHFDGETVVFKYP